MHEVGPLYIVSIREATSGRMLFNDLIEGPLAPQLCGDSALLAAIEDADGRRYWRKTPRKVANG